MRQACRKNSVGLRCTLSLLSKVCLDSKSSTGRNAAVYCTRSPHRRGALPEPTPSRLSLFKSTVHLLQRPLRPSVRRVLRAWITRLTNHDSPTGRAWVSSRAWRTARRRRSGSTAPHKEPQEQSPSAQSPPHSRSFRFLGNPSLARYASLVLSITLHRAHAIPALVSSAPRADAQRRGLRASGAGGGW